jgi:hypothetical protein
MTLYFTEKDVEDLDYFTTLSAAYKLGIQDAERQSLTALRLDIQARNPHVAAVLDAFVRAYRQWHAFHVRIDAEGKEGNLSPQETNELHSLMREREDARVQLVKVFGSVV